MDRNPVPELTEEIERLRQRAEEAEQIERAIAHGEVDAFVVGHREDRRVLLLAGAYQRYRQLVEQMQQGAVTCSPRGDVLYANQRFAEMLDVPISHLFAAPLDSYVAVGDRARLSTFLMLSARNSRIEVDFHRRDGHIVPARVSLASFGDGYASLLITELSLPQRLDELENSLNAMRDSLEILHRGKELDEPCRRALEAISTEVNSLARLADEMRDQQPREAEEAPRR